MAIIYVRGWAGEEDFPIPPQIVENGNAFPAYDGEEFAVQFDYSWYGNDPTAAAFARVVWRDENDNVISTTEWPLPSTSGFVHVAYSVIAPAGVAIGRLQFEGPDIGGPEDRPGRYVGFHRPDVRRVLITADSVPGTALLDGAVTTPKIADGAVTPEKMAVPVEAADVSRWNDATADTGWQAVTLESGFSGPVWVCRIGGIVYWAGEIKRDAGNYPKAYTKVGQLPGAGYRPPRYMRYGIPSFPTGNAPLVAIVIRDNSDDLDIYGVGVSADNIYLGGVSYPSGQSHPTP